MLKDSLKKAMLKYAPELAKDYEEFIKKTFKQMQADLGKELKRVYSSYKWARTFQVVRLSVKKKLAPGQQSHFMPSLVYEKLPYIIDTEALNKNAKKYGEKVALEWYNKVIAKLGPLRNVKASIMRGGDVIVTGEYKGNKVRLDQQRIINVSSRGTLFHQWPSRIYVNGKFMSETAYKKLIRGLGAQVKPDKKPAGYKCGSCEYVGPMSDFRTGHGMLGCPKCRRLNVRRVKK